VTARSGGVSVPLWSTDARPGRSAGRVAAALRPYRTAILVYAGTRVLLLAVAIVGGALRGHGVAGELGHWDGVWYRAVVEHGYARHVLHVQSTLGFFPLYPMVVWPFAHVLSWLSAHSFAWSTVYAGVAVSTVGGLVATVLAQKLATGWWDEASGRRAALLFCLFPGSVVFSMVYAEGILIPLAIATILALERRRWLLAGILAGLATATEPEALVLVLVCAISAARVLRRRGWNDPGARRSLLAPALSVVGAGAFAVFLWVWTGSPFASLVAQHDGWREKTDPLALVHLARMLASEMSLAHFNHPTINLNVVVGLIGALVLLIGLVLVWKSRRQISVEAIVWTLGISFLAVTSVYPFSPNPRVLITAFPLLLVFGHYVAGRWWRVLAWANGISLAGLSLLTFVGTTLRP
jgi:Mannosyltransferase (PIG-V)